ncbi:uncharacterized protein [Choristoneura fumiferana]|uniref:uncharacterized protein n=1 Tax=Choristoneura fumiferana TaxID=7141 RepID=UPI003D1544C3
MDALFAIEPLDQFKNIAQEVLNNLYKKNERATLIEHSVVENAQQEIQQLISDSEFNIDKVVASVESNSWDQSKVNYFVRILNERRIDLLYTLLAHNNSSHGESLASFNWMLKLVLGTSELKMLRYPLLQLVLHTKIVNGKDKQRLYELNKEALGKLISALEDVQ